MTYETLYDLYIVKKQSVSQIAKHYHCSQNKINYWLAKHKIQKRTISEAIYKLRNPNGDPFTIHFPKTVEQGILFGLGIGLYWGEGAKRGKGGIRLANTDARLVKKFLEFLEEFFDIQKSKLKFGLHTFNDIDPQKAQKYWQKELGIQKGQFYKIIVSKVRGEGTYKYKSEYGVICVYFNNTKSKEKICEMIEKV